MAVIYALMNWGNPDNLSGWAIPAATDIAFALGVLSLLGDRVPTVLKVFLASVAIFDDIGAILIIAFFYSHGLSWSALGVAGALLMILFGLNRLNVTKMSLYAFFGVLLWATVLKSGIHATIAGVLVAFCIPMYSNADEEHSPVEELEHDLHGHAVPMAITAGLFLGKPIGVMLFSFLGVKSGLATLPKGINWKHIFGASLLCGIGFTMSLFIGSLAFGEVTKHFDERLGIIIGSLLSGVAGYVYLNMITKRSKRLDLDLTA